MYSVVQIRLVLRKSWRCLVTYFSHVVIFENVLFYFDLTSEIETKLVYYIHIMFSEYRLNYVHLIHDTGYRYYTV